MPAAAFKAVGCVMNASAGSIPVRLRQPSSRTRSLHRTASGGSGMYVIATAGHVDHGKSALLRAFVYGTSKFLGAFNLLGQMFLRE